MESGLKSIGTFENQIKRTERTNAGSKCQKNLKREAGTIANSTL